jgi:uncharacterized protein involved in outer membrane biogenesis
MLGTVTRRRALWLLAASIVVIVTLLAGAALLLVPRYAREIAVWQLRALTGRPVAVAAVDLSLATGEFSVRGVRVTDHDGGLLAELDALQGRFHRRSLLRAHLWIESLTLTNGHVRIVRIGQDRFNISDLLGRPASRRLFDVSIDRLTIAGGWVALEDRVLAPARTWRSDDIRLDARDLTTLAPKGTAVGSTTIAGALVTVRVDDLRLAPVHLRASVNVRDLDLRLPALYMPADAPLTLERGTLDGALSIRVDAAEGTSLDADAVIARLALRRRGVDGDAVTAPELRVLVRELQQRPDAVGLRYASVGGDLTVLDPTTTPPRPLTFSDLTVTASGLEQPMKHLARIAVHASVPGGGEVDIGGTAGVTPPHADMRVRARGLELATLSRYLPLQGRLGGVGTADLRVVADRQTALALTVSGDARVERLSLADAARSVATAASATATGLAYTWPARVALEQLTLTQPSVTVERDAAGTIGLAELLRPPTPTDSDAPPPAAGGGTDPTSPRAATEPAPQVRVAQLRVSEGRATFRDAASGSRVDVTRLALSARNVSWPGSGAAELDLSASVAGAAVSARGTVQAAPRAAEIDLGVRGAELAMLQPWLPMTGRVRGTLGRADVHVSAKHEGELALTVNGDATLEGLELADGTKTPLAVARVAARGIAYTWPGTLRVAGLTLTQPSATIERDAAGAINLAALVRPAGSPAAEAAADPASRPPLDVGIAQFQVDDGRAAITDAGTGGSATVTRIAFAGTDLAWPARGVSRVRLSAEVAAGQLTARGTLDGAQRRGDVALTLRGAELAALQPWLPIAGQVRGAVDADLAGTVELEPFTLSMRGSVGAADVAFLEGTRALLTVTRVDTTGVDLQWPASLTIDRLRVNTPWAQVERTPQGELSLRALFRRRPDRPAAPTSEPVAAGPVPGLELSVRDAVFDNGGASIVDDAVEPAARFELRGSRLELRNLTWPARGVASVALSTPMPGSGTLKARGTFSIEPTRLQLDAELDQVDLAPGRPYAPFDARLGGRLSGRAKITGTFGDAIALVIDGDAAVDRLALGDADRRLATAQHVELAGLRYQYPTSIRIRELTLRKPWALVERQRDGSLEIAALLGRRGASPPPPAPPGAAPASTPSSRVRVAVNKLTLNDGFLRFVDRTTVPDFAEELTSITLASEGLGTNPRRHGTIDLRGMLASGQPLTVRGQIGALTGPTFLDVVVDTQGYPVPRLNPYLDQLSSWIARQGTLTASLRYKLAGDELDASNDITLDALELQEGGRGDADRRKIGLPLGLLVKLLKNRQDVIHLTLPVRGKLSAPDFDYGDALGTALRNLAIKVVSLPFSWIGGMFYTPDARIDSIQVWPVPFQTAQAAPTGPGGEQLQRLATFLKETPAIRLRLRPVTTVADVTALRRAALEARLAAGGDAAARRQAALALYAELFPRRQPPATDEALLAELTRETPTPPGALRTLTTGRTAAVRDGLVRAGVDAGRVEPAESRTAVESEGEPRVEFEIIR